MINLTEKDADKIIAYLRERLKTLQNLSLIYDTPLICETAKELYSGSENDFEKAKEAAKIEIEIVQHYILLLTTGSENEN